MKGKYLERLTLFLILVYTVFFVGFLFIEYPDNKFIKYFNNNKETVDYRVKITKKLKSCSEYINPNEITQNNDLLYQVFKSAISAASFVERSHIRSKNNADYAMVANMFVWAASVIAPLYALIILTSVEKSSSRNKSIAMIVGFIAVLNFINLAYDSHKRWGFSRVSHYHKESLVAQWSFEINMSCLTKKDNKLIEAVYSETNNLLKNFAEHRNSVTPGFFSLELNKILDSSTIILNN